MRDALEAHARFIEKQSTLCTRVQGQGGIGFLGGKDTGEDLRLSGHGGT